ncbi:hypothetical protein F511_17512 [Dorcoceras hygrometricum]|uniref:Uncharacterized protein n=1 Tax=Dorcoceras hygrometricum TaxID=472368 RepID=A0A2Z7CMV3_9LAMI|nr:hypothetical protein F511_17512 [Dorcoceras hygrometricum]
MTSAVTSSFSRKLSADEEEAKEMKRGRAEESADGLALMTSLVTSSQSADDLREQSQESAGSLYIQTQERSDVVKEEIQSQAIVHQQMLFGDGDSKTISVSGALLVEFLLDVQEHRAIAAPVCISSAQKFLKSFNKARLLIF